MAYVQTMLPNLNITFDSTQSAVSSVLGYTAAIIYQLIKIDLTLAVVQITMIASPKYYLCFTLSSEDLLHLSRLTLHYETRWKLKTMFPS